MTQVLPDVSLTEAAPGPGPLRWVGMQGIDLPVLLEEGAYRRRLHARVGAQVDLPAAHVKGIHMSRLYRLLADGLGDAVALSPGVLRQLLQAMVDSHRDCDSRKARLRLAFDLLVERPALVSEGLAGWKAYPVAVEAIREEGGLTLTAQVTVVYSSTCPCSAALSRQLVEQAFLADFEAHEAVSPSAVAGWLRRNATLATPHSQRSLAQVQVRIASRARTLGLLALVDRIEQALQTPVQTAVKRADEQAFAALNGGNLMYVEDAARRIRAALDGRFDDPRIHVRHLESLHPHDAVAWAGPDADGSDADGSDGSDRRSDHLPATP